MGDAMLDPERDLKGATPEALARALLRPIRRRRNDRVRETQNDRYESDRVNDQNPSQDGDST